ncbi:pyruvate kinase [bacterium]|nr:pyruvate kinase [bacterium]
MSDFQEFKKKTKIIATYGPACEKKGVIDEMINNGVDLFRLNASHNAEPKYLKSIIAKIRKVSQKQNRHIGVFLDLQGPKIRVGKFEADKAALKKDTIVDIRVGKKLGNSKELYVDYAHFLTDVAVEDPVFIDDGKIRGIIKSVSANKATCLITTGGIISNNKGINLPYTKLTMSAFTEKDKVDAKTAIKIGCDYVALSFVSTPHDIISFRQFLDENKGDKIQIIAKIERQQAIDNLSEIIKESNAVMVARGDLGVEIGVECVPRIQKQIIQESNRRIKPVIVATQMLESMIESMVATRAEVSDIANAIYDHCDAVMLSAETAVGIDPVNVIKVMAGICEESDKHMVQLRRNSNIIKKKMFDFDTVATSFCRAADQIAEENNASAIMAFTSSGNTPLIAAKLNSLFPIISPTDSNEVCNLTSLYRGVTPMMMPKEFSDISRWTDMINLAVKEAVRLTWLKKGDTVIVTAGIPIGRSRGINSIRIITV